MFVGISSDPPVSGHSDGIRNASDLQWGVGGGGGGEGDGAVLMAQNVL